MLKYVYVSELEKLTQLAGVNLYVNWFIHKYCFRKLVLEDYLSS